MTDINIEKLIATRKSLHQAVQLVSAVPRNLLPPDPTDSMSSLEWNTQLSSLESLPVPSEHGDIRAGLSLATFALYITVNQDSKAALEMSGKSVNQGLDWLKVELARLNFEAESVNLEVPYEIEHYDYATSLQVNTEALGVFSQLYQNTAEVLSGITKKWTDAYDIRCWPHHFDLATLIPLASDAGGEVLKSIGIGLSPGDDGINEPYIYVNIWPQVEIEMLKKLQLRLGHWNTEGWSGGVLTYSEINRFNHSDQTIEQFTTTVIDILLDLTK